MSPDFIYFLRLSPRGHFGHTIPGLFLFCLPASLIVLWVFHRFLKRPLVELFPFAIQERFSSEPVPFRFLPPRRALVVCVGVLTGALTHITWDAFTHSSGVAVALLPPLQQSILFGPLGQTPAYRVLQHASTLVGLAALAFYSWRRGQHVPPGDAKASLSAGSRLKRLVLLTSLPLMLGVLYASSKALTAANALPAFAGHFVVATTTALFLTATGYGVWRVYGEKERGS